MRNPAIQSTASVILPVVSFLSLVVFAVFAGSSNLIASGSDQESELAAAHYWSTQPLRENTMNCDLGSYRRQAVDGSYRRQAVDGSYRRQTVEDHDSPPKVHALASVATKKGRRPVKNQGLDKPLPMLKINEFNPKPMLVIPSSPLRQARIPVIDIHTHFGRRLKGDVEALDQFVDVMNRHNIAICTSLDASLGEETDHLHFLDRKYPDRFLVFAHIDWKGSGELDRPTTWNCNQPGFVRRVCEQIRRAQKNGIVGIKFFKQFGLQYRNSNTDLIRIDDHKFDPIWTICGELALPVIIHTGDPAAFFEPIDAMNERYEELSRHPDWSFYGDDFPSRNELLRARNNVIKKHPDTTFIGAHMAGNPEDLATVGKWMDQFPNLYVEIASRIAELGRQPYTARKFMIKYQDRILFGTDGPWPEERLTFYWRFMETQDENFRYSEKTPPPQGLWNIYGLNLPDQVLSKIYCGNAMKVVPSAKAKYKKAVIEMRQK